MGKGGGQKEERDQNSEDGASHAMNLNKRDRNRKRTLANGKCDRPLLVGSAIFRPGQTALLTDAFFNIKPDFNFLFVPQKWDTASCPAHKRIKRHLELNTMTAWQRLLHRP